MIAGHISKVFGIDTDAGQACLKDLRQKYEQKFKGRLTTRPSGRSVWQLARNPCRCAATGNDAVVGLAGGPLFSQLAIDARCAHGIGFHGICSSNSYTHILHNYVYFRHGRVRG